MRTRVAGSCVVTLMWLAAACPAGEAPKKGPAELQGSWKLLSLEADGKARDVSEGQPFWVIRGNQVLRAGKKLAVLTADPKATPRTIDLQFLRPRRAYEGVYEVKGDTLKVCVNVQADGVKDRPLKLSTKGQPPWRMLVFEKVPAGEENKEEISGFVGMQIRKDGDKLVITAVFEDSPAKKAGLKKDDVLVKVGTTEAADLRETVEVCRQSKPGSDLTVRVRRGGRERDLTVRVGVFPFLLFE
jgi:uncharacterized protein (TIGR03067 family)